VEVVVVVVVVVVLLLLLLLLLFLHSPVQPKLPKTDREHGLPHTALPSRLQVQGR